jgi:hypothetical protein
MKGTGEWTRWFFIGSGKSMKSIGVGVEAVPLFENVAGLDQTFGLESVGWGVGEVSPTMLSGVIVRG